jgi:hypothetical protein
LKGLFGGIVSFQAPLLGRAGICVSSTSRESTEPLPLPLPPYTDKKGRKVFLIYKEIQSGSGAKSYMRKGFLKYGEMHKYLVIYGEAVSHI